MQIVIWGADQQVTAVNTPLINLPIPNLSQMVQIQQQVADDAQAAADSAATVAGMQGDIDQAVEDSSSAIVTATAADAKAGTHATFAEFIASAIPAPVEVTRGLSGGVLVSWRRDASGPIVQSDNSRWSPADEVTPHHFGAVGDGVTDDTPAFMAALATKGTVKCIGSKTYAVDDLIVRGNETLDLRGAKLVPASSACRWLVRLDGYNSPAVRGGRIEDTSYVTVKTAQITAAAVVGATTISLDDTSAIEPGMVLACQGDAAGQFVLRQVVSKTTSSVTLARGVQYAVPSGVAVYCSFGLVSLLSEGSTTFAPVVEDLTISGGGVHLYQNGIGASADIARGTIDRIYSKGPLIAQEVILNNTHDMDRGFIQSWGNRTLSGSQTATAGQTTIDVEALVGPIPIGAVFVDEQVNLRINGVAQSWAASSPATGQYSASADGLTLTVPALVGGETISLQIFDRPFVSVYYDPHGDGTVQGAHKWLRSLYLQNHSCFLLENKGNSGGLIHLTQVNYDAASLFGLKVRNTNKLYGSHTFLGYSPYPLVLDLDEGDRPIMLNGLWTKINTEGHFDQARVSASAAITVTAWPESARIEGKPKVLIDGWWGPDYSAVDPHSAIGIGSHAERNTETFGRLVQARASAEPGVTLRRSGGTIAAPTPVANNDIVAEWLGQAHDGTGYQTVGNRRLVADQAHSASARGMREELLITKRGETSPSLHSVARWDNNGFARLGRTGQAETIYGAGDPSGVVSAAPGSIFHSDGSVSSPVFFKTSGTGSSGWVSFDAKATEAQLAAGPTPQMFGDGSAGWQVPINAAIDALHAQGGGRLVVPPLSSPYEITAPIVIKSHVHIDFGKAQIKLANGANCDMIQTDGFYSLTGTNNVVADGSPRHFRLTGGNFDGNASNQSPADPDACNGMALYGYGFTVENMEIFNVRGNGCRSEWGQNGPWATGHGLEASFLNLRFDGIGRRGFWFKGPHDANIEHLVVINASQEADNTYDGILAEPYANGRWYNPHVWHRADATNRARWAANFTNGGSEVFGGHFEGCRKQLRTTGFNSFAGVLCYAPRSDDPQMEFSGERNTFAGRFFSSAENPRPVVMSLGASAAAGTSDIRLSVQVTAGAPTLPLMQVVNTVGNNSVHLRATGVDAANVFTGSFGDFDDVSVMQQYPARIVYRKAPASSTSSAFRPTVATPGQQHFDTTLNKPIWRNAANTAWVDATGTSV